LKIFFNGSEGAMADSQHSTDVRSLMPGGKVHIDLPISRCLETNRRFETNLPELGLRDARVLDALDWQTRCGLFHFSYPSWASARIRARITPRELKSIQHPDRCRGRIFICSQIAVLAQLSQSSLKSFSGLDSRWLCHFFRIPGFSKKDAL
jgi:hypothetical protein